MKLLVATNGYPTKKNPTRQVFVKKIYERLKKVVEENATDMESAQVDIIHNKYYSLFTEGQDEGNIVTRGMKIVFLILSYAPYILYKAKDYDIIYSHGVLYSASLMRIAAGIHGKKLVCYVHGGDVNTHSRKRGVFYKIIEKSLAACNLVITNSHYQRERIEREYNAKSVVISPGYNEAVYSYSNSHTYSEKTTDVLFAGNAIKRKGIDVLLKAVKDHRQYYESNSVKIKIHCSGVLKDEYIRYAEKFNLTGIVTFGDRLEEKELARQYRQSRIFVFPSREEPLGMVGIEAIASGAVLIASKTGGIREYVEHGKNGFLFNVGNPDELHSLIEHVLESYPDYEKQLEMSSKSVAGYSLKSGIDETLKQFRDITSISL